MRIFNTMLSWIFSENTLLGILSADRVQVIRDYGEKAAENMDHYTRDWIESKKQFMLGQLKSWCDEVGNRSRDASVFTYARYAVIHLGCEIS